MLRLLRRTGRLLLLPSKYPIILRVSSFTSYRHSHPQNVQLVLQELKSDVASFTTHVQTCLATNQVFAGCEKLLQKVESNSTFCNKICLCCAFYRPNANLFCSKLRNATVRRDSRTVLSNQKSVFFLLNLQLPLFVARQIRTWVVKHATCFSTRSVAILRNKLHVFVTRFTVA